MSYIYFSKTSDSYYDESIDLYLKDEDQETQEIAVPENFKFLVYEIVRAHSSGHEQSRGKYFDTFTSMVEYLNEHLPKTAIEEWDDNDHFFTDYTMKKEVPNPNEKFCKIVLSPKRLYDFMTLSSSRGGKIYGPYSKFCLLVPYELHVYRLNSD
jgi:hypothetical protein